MITIVNYGAGNIFSIQNMLKKIGVPSVLAGEVSAIENAHKLILPGVGAFDTCAAQLQQSGLQETLHRKVTADKTPVLGICVGMQLLLSGSEEGLLPGLGWLNGKVIKFSRAGAGATLKIPHMGWAELHMHKASRLFTGMNAAPRFYFVHSYHAVMNNEEEVVAYSDHGYPFAACIEKENILGVQFHPEKSHKYGMQLLENFVQQY